MDPAQQDDHETRQMRRELDRAGVPERHHDDRIRLDQPVDRRDMTVVHAYQYTEHSGLSGGQIYVREYAAEGGEEYCVESWDGAEAHHLAGPYGSLNEAAEAWREAVTV